MKSFIFAFKQTLPTFHFTLIHFLFFSQEGAVHAWKQWPGFSHGIIAFVAAVTIEETYNMMTKEEGADAHGHH